MKSTGIVRKIDDLGRFVLPMELRRIMDIEPGDPMEIYTDESCVIFKKYQPACIFCGEAKDIKRLKGKNICQDCLDTLRNI